MRGPTYATLFVVIPNFETRGVWALGIAALLVVDVAISIADFALERRSRANLGGLPSGEYVLHMVMAMLFGAFVALLAPNLAARLRLPADLVGNRYLAPGWVRLTLAIFAIGVAASGFMDAVASARLTRKIAHSIA